ncbi:Hypothetical predicted protein [Scomber scombrus]|uniref:Uncharacterized protein n=1 Tax=Scomber scombrus TaxID=13677 RepID=A0AAV1Q6K2_SCOSC
MEEKQHSGQRPEREEEEEEKTSSRRELRGLSANVSLASTQAPIYQNVICLLQISSIAAPLLLQSRSIKTRRKGFFLSPMLDGIPEKRGQSPRFRCGGLTTETLVFKWMLLLLLLLLLADEESPFPPRQDAAAAAAAASISE